VRDAITVETDLFEHRRVQPHFINPCCFGEDFAAWLKGELASLAVDGFGFSDPIQEDYGWGFWATHGKDHFWIALSYVGEGPQEEPAQWIISVNESRGVIKRLFGRSVQRVQTMLHERIWRAIAANPAIKTIKI
jgi:hypothetical protein